MDGSHWNIPATDSRLGTCPASLLFLKGPDGQGGVALIGFMM
jgi:hypothetical protein